MHAHYADNKFRVLMINIFVCLLFAMKSTRNMIPLPFVSS
jgi:hypothetical protein